jgi:hypothetical protein
MLRSTCSPAKRGLNPPWGANPAARSVLGYELLHVRTDAKALELILCRRDAHLRARHHEGPQQEEEAAYTGSRWDLHGERAHTPIRT